MQVLHEYISEPTSCAYLQQKLARMHYSLALQLTADEYEDLMNQGYRKFGGIFFKPVCDLCHECKPVRVEAERFKPDRSQRRCLRDNVDLELRFGAATVDSERLNLYRRYHKTKAKLKNWPNEGTSVDDYAGSFVLNPVPNVEISAWQNGKLRAVILTDITPNTVSDIYHYHDPDWHERGLGTFMILQTILLAQRMEKRWVHLGYYVDGCDSMSYKLRFKPGEVLEGGVWRESASSGGEEGTADGRS